MAKHLIKTSVMIVATILLVACNKDNSQIVTTDNKAANIQNTLNEIRTIEKAEKMTNDATAHAHLAWQFMQQAEHLVNALNKDILKEQVRQPLRKIQNDWLTQVKMTDAVTEGNYALCRKALQSLDIWARAIEDDSSQIVQKQKDYERDREQCEIAIKNPSLGNTDPKKVVAS